MYISYSGFKSAKCPTRYWHSYIAETKPLEPDNSVNSLYGSIVGTLMEDFYMKGLWREKNVQTTLENRIESTYQKVVVNEVKRGRVIRWKTQEDSKPNYASREELLVDVRDTIARAVRIVRFYRLAGPRMEAEVKLDVDVKGHRLGGRADFIIQRTNPHHDLVILDGKGSKHRASYVDPQQLKWYALLYSMRNDGALPDKLGFVYWRFDPPESMDWVDFSRAELDELFDEVMEVVAKIERGMTRRAGELIERTQRAFPTRASKEECRFCTFIGLCKEGQEVMEKKPSTGV
jgi:hypothetical protein